uniref:C2H2-type domain-containing protein n=1 Tax=Anopheles atroparvus TaxID=41427 RepID=A0A182JHV9_ANOAO
MEKGAKDIIRKSKLLAPGKDSCPYPGCDFTAITYRAMYVHKRKAHMSVYKCEVCNRSFAFEYDLKSHLLLHTGEKPFKCELCDRSFRRMAMYRRHLQTHAASNAIPSYTCEICQKSFKMARYLQAHKLTHSSERNFTCETCRTSFKTKGELKRHRRYKHGIEINEAIILKAVDTGAEGYYITEVIE